MATTPMLEHDAIKLLAFRQERQCEISSNQSLVSGALGVDAGVPHYNRKPKAAIAPAARAPRPYCCPAPSKATAADLEVLLADALEPEAEAVFDVLEPDVVELAEEEVDEALPPKVMLVESMFPHVSSILVLQAVCPVKSLG